MRGQRRPVERPSKHTKPVLRLRLVNGEETLVVAGTMSMTKRRPWTLRVERHIANRRAKQARKANRGR